MGKGMTTQSRAALLNGPAMLNHDSRCCMRAPCIETWLRWYLFDARTPGWLRELAVQPAHGDGVVMKRTVESAGLMWLDHYPADRAAAGQSPKVCGVVVLPTACDLLLALPLWRHLRKDRG